MQQRKVYLLETVTFGIIDDILLGGWMYDQGDV